MVTYQRNGIILLTGCENGGAVMHKIKEGIWSTKELYKMYQDREKTTQQTPSFT